MLLYLLRRCHGLIYRLIAESEPISEELMPIVSIPSSSDLLIGTLAYLSSDHALLIGQQAVDDKEMPERGDEVWWTV